MNERIKELARQADAYAWQQIDEGADYDQHPRYFTEKFAELIVRECAKIANEPGARIPGYYIKKHFGVEK